MSYLDKLAAVPDPWNRTFLMIVVGASIVTAAILCVGDGANLSAAVALVLISCLLAAWPMASRRTVESGPSRLTAAAVSPRRTLAFFGGALLFSAAALFMAKATYLGWTVMVASLMLLAAWQIFLPESRTARLILAPLLLGAPFMIAAIALGRPHCGGFPAVLTILFASVAFAMRDLETRLRADSHEQDPASHPAYHRTLAVVSTILFFFGVVSLWPWLGKLHGDRYLWILIVGLLAPLFFLWGRLRQPHGDHPLNALVRFDRLVPYIGIVLLLAMAVG